jgi:MFS transporter, OFA family, oxalate/formate antiporter
MSHQSTASSHQEADRSSAPDKGRWLLVGAALLLQFSIGAVYAWSVFSSALQDEEAAPDWGLSKVEASLPFTVTIAMIFIGSYIGGRIQDKKGPRIVALVGGVIYAAGIILAAFAGGADQLWLLIAG